MESDEYFQEPFGPGVNTQLPAFIPKSSDGVFTHFLDVGRSMEIATQDLEFMLQVQYYFTLFLSLLLQAYGWIDDSTQTLDVQIPILNAESGVVGLLQVLTEITNFKKY